METEKINNTLIEIEKTLVVIKMLYEHDHELIDRHDRILLRGNGQPGLVDSVRRLENVVTDFINSVRRAEDEKRKRDDEFRTKLALALIGVGLPALVGFVWQFIVFWVKIAPALEAAAGK